MINDRKKIYFISLILLTLFFLTACELLPKSYDLKVRVTDISGEMLTARIDLLKNGKIIASKTGSTVIFKDLEKGTYQLVGTAGSNEVKKETVNIVDSDVLINLKFSTLVAESQKVHKIIFGAEDDKSIIIEELGDDENIIMGVATLNFDTTDGNKGYVDVILERGISGESAGFTIKALEEKNPAYVYREPVIWEVGRIKSIDHMLRKQEKLLLSNIQTAYLPELEKTEYHVGSTRPFNCMNFETGEWEFINATVKGVGDHCIIFVDDSVEFCTEGDIARYVEVFDYIIYPTMVSFYSRNFDIDGNDKLGIVLIDMKDKYDEIQGIVAGYFWAIDFFPKEMTIREYGLSSNEGDFIYLNAQLLDPELNDLGFTVDDHFSTIAHEFQHLLYFYRSLEKGWVNKRFYLGIDDTWINEGMSTYAEQITGYSEVDNRVYYYFLEYPGMPTSEVSLLYWEGILHNYGIANLFTNYIVEQYGKGVLHSIYEKNTDPLISIEDYARMSFNDIFMNFIIANKLYSLNLAQEYTYEYALEYDPEHFVLEHYSSVPFMKSAAVKYYLIEGDGSDIKINISGGPSEDCSIGVFIYRY